MTSGLAHTDSDMPYRASVGVEFQFLKFSESVPYCTSTVGDTGLILVRINGRPAGRGNVLSNQTSWRNLITAQTSETCSWVTNRPTLTMELIIL